jgi:hypothetical protein
MSLVECSECGRKLSSKNAARIHYRQYHAGEIETPAEHVDRVESEQRDFAGNEPDTSDHDPEYLTEPSDTSKPDTRSASLHEFERENDDSITEYTDTEETE